MHGPVRGIDFVRNRLVDLGGLGKALSVLDDRAGDENVRSRVLRGNLRDNVQRNGVLPATVGGDEGFITNSIHESLVATRRGVNQLVCPWIENVRIGDAAR